MIALIQQDIPRFVFGLINSAGVLTALGYAISIERRLSRLEGKIACICRYQCQAGKEDDDARSD